MLMQTAVTSRRLALSVTCLVNMLFLCLLDKTFYSINKQGGAPLISDKYERC